MKKKVPKYLWEKPREIQDVYFGFDWDSKKIWALDLPIVDMDISELTWHFDLPFWELEDTFSYNCTPYDVMQGRAGTRVHRQRVVDANASYPIDVYYIKDKRKYGILDGLHRVVKLYQLGQKTVKVRILPEDRALDVLMDKK
jgi:hypothetical protein